MAAIGRFSQFAFFALVFVYGFAHSDREDTGAAKQSDWQPSNYSTSNTLQCGDYVACGIFSKWIACINPATFPIE